MKHFFAELAPDGTVQNVVVATQDWPHRAPGTWVKLPDKTRPDGAFNFQTGAFE